MMGDWMIIHINIYTHSLASVTQNITSLAPFFVFYILLAYDKY